MLAPLKHGFGTPNRPVGLRRSNGLAFPLVLLWLRALVD
jgi:hypothetical protein